MRCSNCGNELPSNAMFCDNCGASAVTEPLTEEKQFCFNCGTAIEQGATFCSECGQPVGETAKAEINYVFCGNCGAKMQEGTKICGSCGHCDGAEAVYSTQNKKKSPMTAVAVILVALIVAAAGVGGYYIYMNSQTENDKDNESNVVSTASPEAVASPTPQVTIAPTPTPVVSGELVTYYVVNCEQNISLRDAPSTTGNVIKSIALGQPVSYVEPSQNGFAKVIYNGTTGYALQSYLSKTAPTINKGNQNSSNKAKTSGSTVVTNPSYITYTDADYNFSCSYPSHFSLYNDSDTFVRYSLKAPDNTALIKICGTNNKAQLSVQTVIDNFISSYPGTVEYKNSGDAWCAINTVSNGKSHYGYFNLTGNMIRGFEMHYDEIHESVYDKYINDIYAHIKFN